MEQVQQILNSISGKSATILLVISIVIAFLQCFFGYRLLRIWTAVIGFAIGFFLGWLITNLVADAGNWVPVIVGVICGVLLALVAFKLYLVGVFIYVLVIVYQAIQRIPFDAKLPAWVSIVAGIVIGILAGLLAVKFSRPLIILVTGVTGSVNGIGGLASLIPALAAYQVLRIVLILVLIVLGMLVQFKTTKKYQTQR